MRLREGQRRPPQLSVCPAAARSTKPLGSQLRAFAGRRLGFLHLCRAWKLQAEGGAVAGLGSLASRLCEIAVLHGLVDSVPRTLVSVFCQVFHFFQGKGQLVPVPPRLDAEADFNFLNLSLNDFPASSAGKESACNAGHLGSIPGSERSSGEGIGHPLQYSWVSLVAQLVNNPPAVRET